MERKGGDPFLGEGGRGGGGSESMAWRMVEVVEVVPIRAMPDGRASHRSRCCSRAPDRYLHIQSMVHSEL
jgi:hypothetical protein